MRASSASCRRTYDDLSQHITAFVPYLPTVSHCTGQGTTVACRRRKPSTTVIRQTSIPLSNSNGRPRRPIANYRLDHNGISKNPLVQRRINATSDHPAVSCVARFAQPRHLRPESQPRRLHRHHATKPIKLVLGRVVTVWVRLWHVHPEQTKYHCHARSPRLMSRHKIARGR
jgi:hypothetical protein